MGARSKSEGERFLRRNITLDRETLSTIEGIMREDPGVLSVSGAIRKLASDYRIGLEILNRTSRDIKRGLIKRSDIKS